MFKKKVKKLKRKKPERRQLTVCLCQLRLFWCFFLLILDIFYTFSNIFMANFEQVNTDWE